MITFVFCTLFIVMVAVASYNIGTGRSGTGMEWPPIVGSDP